MKGIEKISNWILTFLSVIVGLWASYTAYDASESQKPLDKRSAIASSYRAEITSALERGDEEKVRKLRNEHEIFESSWRKNILLATKLSTARSIGFDLISPKVKQEIIALHNQIPSEFRGAIISDQESADISYLSGDYASATQGYSAIININPSNKYAGFYAANALLRAQELDPGLATKPEEVSSILKSLKTIKNEDSGSFPFHHETLLNLEKNIEKIQPIDQSK